MGGGHVGTPVTPASGRTISRVDYPAMSAPAGPPGSLSGTPPSPASSSKSGYSRAKKKQQKKQYAARKRLLKVHDDVVERHPTLRTFLVVQSGLSNTITASRAALEGRTAAGGLCAAPSPCTVALHRRPPLPPR